ncbi:hypothetical protein V1277_002545 [Bradyrhizobium sp. AZCC 1588]|uniref:hypothetical protein n=1 Tax=unclassified Bradyrhizobium TaxID=2631580 RepID=UPI002FF0E4E9
MSKLKVPSVQHLARNWQSTPERTCKKLVTLANSPPTFNYNALFFAARDMLVFKQPYDEIVEGIKRAVKRADVRQNLLGVLPLIRDHFAEVSPDFVQSIDRRYYSIGRGLRVPFDPPLLYGVGGQLTFPWFSFWRQNPLAKERLSLFVTLVDDLLSDDPDLGAAKFQILDFSVPKVKGREPDRELRIIDARDIPRVNDSTKVEMLRIFAEGYLMAEAELAGRPAAAEGRERRDPMQGELFDDEPRNP